MSRTHNRTQRIWSPAQRGVLGLLCLVLALLLLAGAGWIAFAYESSSMLYKFGWDKRLLRAGKVVGLAAATLVLLQLVLSARLRFLDRIFGLNRLYTVHRLLGLAVAAVVVLHPVLVFLPERMWFIPLELRYWPEFTGLLLLVTLAGSALVSTWRTAFGLPFHIWWLGHRVGAVLIVALLAVHVLNVSESFEQGLPRQALFAALGGWLLLYAWVRTRGVRSRRRPLEGDLTIKDVTRTVTLPLTWFGVQENPLKKNQLVAGIEVAFSLDRMEYGVGTGKFLEMGVLGKDVQVLVALEVVRDK